MNSDVKVSGSKDISRTISCPVCRRDSVQFVNLNIICDGCRSVLRIFEQMEGGVTVEVVKRANWQAWIETK